MNGLERRIDRLRSHLGRVRPRTLIICLAIVPAVAGFSGAAPGATQRDPQPGARDPAAPDIEVATALADRLPAIRSWPDSPVLSEVAKLLASDGRPNEQFGRGIAMSGARALIGAATYVFDSGPGSAYVFERSAAGTWNEVAKLTASDGDVFDLFGANLALSGDRALIGASFDYDLGPFAGSAYVFERQDDSSWAEVAKLTARDARAYDQFGTSVQLQGRRAVIGARAGGYWGEQRPGSAYVFERQQGRWMEVARLTAGEDFEEDDFGDAVALDGNRIVIGAELDDEAGFEAGAAFVFERQIDGTWVKVAKLTASDAEEGDEFGGGLALWNDRLLVGAPYNDDAAGNAGVVYVFERGSDGEWSEVAKLSPSLPNRDLAYFGRELALSGGRAVGGDASYAQGSAFVWERQGDGTWEEVAQLVASDREWSDRLGTGVALWGDEVLVGDSVQRDLTGAAYVYSLAASWH